MTDTKDAQQAIHAAIDAFCRQKHDYSFKPDAPVVRLHEPTFGADEIKAAVDVLLSTKVTMGERVKKLEREFAALHGLSHAVMSNSGSSANLLAMAAVSNVAWEPHLQPGDEVIVPALSWSTTVWPIIQHGLIPVVVDIDPRTFCIDPAEIERAIGPKTRAVVVVHVYGNPCDMDAVMDICRRRNLLLIEDACEALGAAYKGRPVGSFGAIGTFSFYYSHHVTTLEGGISVTSDVDLAELMRVLRAHGWTREMENPQPIWDKYPAIDPRFLFINLGYNLRATELQGAFGSIQLPKLGHFVALRRDSARAWQQQLAPWSKYFDVQQETEGASSSWFGFSIVLRDEAPFTVGELSNFLQQAHIETRPIICGNIAAQPGLRLYSHRVVGDLRHSTRVMMRGTSIGNHQAVDAQARQYVCARISEFMQRLRLA